jgi:tetratricopeptide (TPR) repeat protein
MSKEKGKSEAVNAVVVTTKRRWGAKGVLLVILAVCVIGGVAGGVWYTQRPDEAKTVVVDDEKYQQTLKDTGKLRATQDYDGAKKVWQGYIENDSTNAEKYKAYMQIAALDESKGDYQAALAGYREAEKLGTGEWRAENEAIARCSEKLGDLQTALTYYQRTLDTFPGGEQYDSDLRYYKNKIEKLKQALEAKQNG